RPLQPPRGDRRRAAARRRRARRTRRFAARADLAQDDPQGRCRGDQVARAARLDAAAGGADGRSRLRRRRAARARIRAGRPRARGRLLLVDRRPRRRSGRRSRGGGLTMRSAFWSIAWFDFVRRLKATSTWVYVVLYGVLAGVWMAAAGG